jgi:hypothetical protein
MQEEIQIRGESKRTVIKFFTDFSGQTGTDGNAYFVVTDMNDRPLKISDSKFDTEFGLDAENYNIPLSTISSGYRIYSGSVVETEYKLALTQDEKDSMSSRFVNGINQKANPGGQTNSSINPYSTVFFEEYPFEDYHMNVKVNRSIGTLDTLNIYNVSLNEPPKFSNNTGVLVGKLEAIQVLNDENGEKIRIPLKNSVVGIFNPSEKFPSISSSDSEGNRIRLNLYETIPQVDNPYDLKGFSSFQSYLTDINYSKADNENKTIPEEYKYTTVTNERGEFILQNIPIGQQTLMIEVDLLKFGLEPEEIALNFFPYPSQDDPNVSEIPHLFFGQYPINIVPSWGDFQTGYTEMSLTVALDLRKWNTYYTYPIAAKYGQGATRPYVLEELQQQGYSNPLTVLVRDMTKPLKINDRPKIELVKVPDIYDKNLDLYAGWNSEFKVRNSKVEFDVTGFNAFKLPANLYDPAGINSKGEKGVWLNAYTFKIFYADEKQTWQTTGMASNWESDGKGGAYEVYANHYDLNRTDDWYTKQFDVDTKMPPTALGVYPYEKPWSLTYPDDYKITKKPQVQNPYKQWDQNNNNNPITSVSGQTIIPQLEPRYLDGDLIGGSDAWETNANGFGLQDYDPGIFGNMFSREVSKNELWRYEAIDWWGEEWSNGYTPGTTSAQQKYQVIPGCPSSGKPDIPADVAERYYRLESGYAYWLKPRGWPRVNVQNAWGDLLLSNDANQLGNHNSDSAYPGYYSVWPGVYKYLDEVTMLVGPRAPWWSRYGRLTAYRVEKPYYNNPEKPPFTEKFVVLNFGQILCDGTSPNGGSNRDRSLCNFDVGCGSGDQFFYVNNHTGRIKNRGTIKVTIDGKELFPDGEINIMINSFMTITLPANTNYNPKGNSYERADYEIVFPAALSGTQYLPCAPYGGNSGEMCFVFASGHEWTYLSSKNRLFYYKDGGNGLPASVEEDEKKNYYLTSIPCFPLDAGNLKFTDTAGDLTRWNSYYDYWGRFRIEGYAYMANHRNFSSPTDSNFRWTRSKPSQFMFSYQTSDGGSNTGKYFRLLSGNGDPWGFYDLDFSTID